jgi:nicotinamide riboside transporter PnuC
MELLIELTTIAGAGYAASVLFDWLREKVDAQTPAGRYLHAPQYARWITLILSGLIATAAAYTAQALGGPVADPAVTAAWAAIASQATHAYRHLSTAPVHGEGQ